jgi:ATP-dependent helicase/nuclease subunit A
MLSTPATVGRVLRLPDPGPGRQLSLLDGGAPPAPPPAPVGAGVPAAGDGAPVPAALSYSALARHAECGYRFYLERILRLPAQAPPPSLLAGEAPGEGIDLLLRGTLVHELLEAMDLSRDAPTPGPDAVREAGRRHEVELDEAAVADQLALLDGFARSPLRARLLAARSLRREHGFAFLLDPAQEAGPLLTGVVDVLAFEADGAALVVDYKSDAVEGADLDALVERAYGVQRRIYALAALRAGAPAVEVAHLFLSRPAEPVARRFEAADEPTLQHELRERAAGVLAGEYPVSERPHRGLCATCPGRNGLCRWGTEMTDRELAA